MSVVSFYDAMSEDYDRFMDWEARLVFELPFLRALFDQHDVTGVLDVACGTLTTARQVPAQDTASSQGRADRP